MSDHNYAGFLRDYNNSKAFVIAYYMMLINIYAFQESRWPVLTHFIAILLAALCVTRGVKTIEKVSMLLVPLLLLILLFTFIWSLTREYADKGLQFLFTPHWGRHR